jgi:hypothetical protein
VPLCPRPQRKWSSSHYRILIDYVRKHQCHERINIFSLCDYFCLTRLKKQSRILAKAALLHKVASDRLSGGAWEGLRDHVTTGRHSGPFHNLPGPVGDIKFVYPDIIPQVDTSTYPHTLPLLEIIKRWNPDDTDNIPNPFVEMLQVFNYSNPEERMMAEAYRNAEVPFKVFGTPEIEAVAEKWTDKYLGTHMRGPNIHYKVFYIFSLFGGECWRDSGWMDGN